MYSTKRLQAVLPDERRHDLHVLLLLVLEQQAEVHLVLQPRARLDEEARALVAVLGVADEEDRARLTRAASGSGRMTSWSTPYGVWRMCSSGMSIDALTECAELREPVSTMSMRLATYDCMRQGNQISFVMRADDVLRLAHVVRLVDGERMVEARDDGLAHQLLHREDAVAERLVVVHEVERPRLALRSRRACGTRAR